MSRKTRKKPRFPLENVMAIFSEIQEWNVGNLSIDFIYASTSATARTQPALAALTFTGKQKKVKP
jgi:hypothetical protein